MACLLYPEEKGHWYWYRQEDERVSELAWMLVLWRREEPLSLPRITS
jgi:hypothetical protein